MKVLKVITILFLNVDLSFKKMKHCFYAYHLTLLHFFVRPTVCFFSLNFLAICCPTCVSLNLHLEKPLQGTKEPLHSVFFCRFQR